MDMKDTFLLLFPTYSDYMIVSISALVVVILTGLYFTFSRYSRGTVGFLLSLFYTLLLVLGIGEANRIAGQQYPEPNPFNEGHCYSAGFAADGDIPALVTFFEVLEISGNDIKSYDYLAKKVINFKNSKEIRESIQGRVDCLEAIAFMHYKSTRSE